MAVETYRENFGRETLSAVVEGSHFETDHLIGRYGCGKSTFPYYGAIVEVAVAYTLVHYKTLCIGRRLKRIALGLPRQHYLLFLVECGSEMRHRKRLHDVRITVFVRKKAQNAFIHSPSHHKSEARVKTITHIGKVLMRHELEQHGGNARHPRLKVTLVPHAASCPFRVSLTAQVISDLCLHKVTKITIELTRGTVGELPTVL